MLDSPDSSTDNFNISTYKSFLMEEVFRLDKHAFLFVFHNIQNFITHRGTQKTNHYILQSHSSIFCIYP